MGMIDTGIAKSRATASDARADLAEAKSRLMFAEAWLKVTQSGHRAANALADSKVGQQGAIAPVMDAVLTQTDAINTRAIADVDDLRLRRQSAQGRLTVAEKSQTAMTRLAEETDKIIGD